MEKIVIITDTWTESVNGVTTALVHTKEELERQGFAVTMIHPGLFKTVLSLPQARDVKLAMSSRKHLKDMILAEKPKYIHIATEGSLGLVGRMTCLHNHWKFTTSYHTHFPAYVKIRYKYFESTTYSYLRWFHNAAANTMVSTGTLKQDLESHGFRNVVIAPLGVDLNLFKKNPQAKLPDRVQTPVFAFLGRVAPEKNITAFLECKLPGSKLIIGDGPSKESLAQKYPDAVFVGYQKGQALVDLLSISNVLVFPSKTDTFGLVIIEAMACGVPAAGYDVEGPKDIITDGVDGFLGDDLEKNAIKCLQLKPEDCIKKAQMFSWASATEKFVQNLVNFQG